LGESSSSLTFLFCFIFAFRIMLLRCMTQTLVNIVVAFYKIKVRFRLHSKKDLKVVSKRGGGGSNPLKKLDMT
jgi:hypothetical protein